ncbi:YibE/F family protein [Haloechinothrix sp. YIM 98757]|uniref:YibE/F family protein n=1 Tax=Haloechinothrix aidingensis TaxID=2752311 RepID=A0A838A0E8_9PSEU|nr:YibE/F family protein [Haloechinothrix aidingensis]
MTGVARHQSGNQPDRVRRSRAAPEEETGPIQRVPERSGPGAAHTGPRHDGHAHGTGDAGGHAHAHAHGPATPAPPRVRSLLTALLVPFALAAIVGMVLLYPFGDELPGDEALTGTPVNADVVAVAESSCTPQGDVDVDTGGGEPTGQGCVAVDIELTEGPAAGSTITKTEPVGPGRPRFAPGDAIVLEYHGAAPEQAGSYQVVDFQRGTPLLVLAGAFALAVLLLGRWQGARALLGLGLSFVVIALFILPAILAGQDPVLVGIVGAGVIMFLTLYLSHGLSARTSVAVLGTLVSLTLIGVISAVFSELNHLTGLDEPTSTLIGTLGGGIDARGLLLAGIVIGALGVLDDVTVTQSSAVWELRHANPALSWRQLYAAGLRIGRDHVAASVNTLVMAYAGAALPVLLYSAISGVGMGSILGSQDIAQEIVRTLAGSIGIVAAVPVTTALAALIVTAAPAGTGTDTHSHEARA